MAELGFVCDGPNSYQLWLGGTPAQTRLAELYKERVKIKDLESEIEPLFRFWKASRKASESFGHFVSRVGFQVRSSCFCCFLLFFVLIRLFLALERKGGPSSAAAGSDWSFKSLEPLWFGILTLSCVLPGTARYTSS